MPVTHSASASAARPRTGTRDARGKRTGRSAHKRAIRKRVNENRRNKGFITDSIEEEISRHASRHDAFDLSVQNGIDDNPATMRVAQRQKL
ncbi:hypothetical protein PBS_65120 [Paraburkholderia sp. 2C]